MAYFGGRYFGGRGEAEDDPHKAEVADANAAVGKLVEYLQVHVWVIPYYSLFCYTCTYVLFGYTA